MKLVTTSLLTLIVLSMCCQSPPETPAEQQAVNMAIQWLALIDSGKYEESWEESSAIFRRAVTRENWGSKVDFVRSPLGKLISRKVKSAIYRTTLPGAPDAEYVVITFTSSFEHKKSAIETVTPMKEEKGVWRVSGYYIR